MASRCIDGLRFSKVFIDGGSRFHQTDDRDACLCGSLSPSLVSLFFPCLLLRSRVASIVCGVTFALLPKKFGGFCLDGHLLLILISTSLCYFGMIPHLLLFQFWTIFSFGPFLLNNQCCRIHVVRVCGDDVPSVLWDFFLFASGSVELRSNGFWFRLEFLVCFPCLRVFFSVARISGEFFFLAS